MIRTLLVTFALVALAAAVTARLHDAPYVSYMQGDQRGAVDGLMRKAQAGDGFAAYLLGDFYVHEPRKAQEWLLAAVAKGEPRAAIPFLRVAAAADCGSTMSLLDSLARARDAQAAALLGDFALNGICGPRDVTRAAGYYIGASRLDHNLDRRFERLPPLAADQLVRSLPERYDVTPDEAHRRFVEVAPRLLVTQ